MSTESSYYVPEQSKLPIITATGMGLMAYGAASWVIGGGNMVFTAGLIIMAIVMFKWWSLVIDENMRGMANDQLKRSYVLGMLWFIFSEVMFFAAFFGALFYLRVIVNSWLGGDAAIGIFDDTPTDAAVLHRSAYVSRNTVMSDCWTGLDAWAARYDILSLRRRYLASSYMADCCAYCSSARTMPTDPCTAAASSPTYAPPPRFVSALPHRNGSPLKICRPPCQ